MRAAGQGGGAGNGVGRVRQCIGGRVNRLDAQAVGGFADHLLFELGALDGLVDESKPGVARGFGEAGGQRHDGRIGRSGCGHRRVSIGRSGGWIGGGPGEPSTGKAVGAVYRGKLQVPHSKNGHIGFGVTPQRHENSFVPAAISEPCNRGCKGGVCVPRGCASADAASRNSGRRWRHRSSLWNAE